MMNDFQGWINLYKPKDISSFGVIKKIKKKFNIKKIGHAGTLDPLAEGVLPIAIGQTTKLIMFVQNQIKEYEFEIKWGEQTSTDDKEGKIINTSNKLPTVYEIINGLKKFQGKIIQTPPKASAVKINGVPAYKLFRSNVKFNIKEKYVYVHSLSFMESKDTFLTKLKIKCGKGFYVRSFARDLAELLGTKGHIYSLKRTKVGKFDIQDAILLDDLLKIRQMQNGFREIHPSISMLDDILAYEIDDENLIKNISHGKSVKIDKDLFYQTSLNIKERTLVFLTKNDQVLSYGKFDGNLFVPSKVLLKEI